MHPATLLSLIGSALLASPLAAQQAGHAVEMHYADAALVAPPSETFLARFSAAVPAADNPLATEMKAAIAQYDAAWGALPQAMLEGGPTMRQGSRGSRVSALRQRLGLPSGDVFDAALAVRIIEYRRAHGLSGEALADAALLSSLNRGHAYHRALAQLNLRRMQRLPAELGERHVIVDLAAQELRMVENGKVVDSMRVVVGAPETPTPIMAGVLRHSILNPYWNVPFDLARKTVAPRFLREGSPYLARTGFEPVGADGRTLRPAEVDWQAAAAGEIPLEIRQRPGPLNGMGEMKFMFPNTLGIYLHDTPNKALFDAGERLFSAGCVRLADARRFADWLHGTMPEAQGDAPEQRVDVADPVPIYLAYWTAVPTRTGFDFRDDVYGRDAWRLDWQAGPASTRSGIADDETGGSDERAGQAVAAKAL